MGRVKICLALASLMQPTPSSFNCTAYPFIIRHECLAYGCNENIQSLIVLRSPRRVPSTEFNTRILSLQYPLDFEYGSGDSALAEITLEVAAENDILFMENQHGGSLCSTCPHCNWGSFGSQIFTLLRTFWGTDRVETLPEREFQTTVDLMSEFRIREHFILEGSDQSDEIHDGVVRNLFDSRPETNLYEQLTSRLNRRGFSVGTHISLETFSVISMLGVCKI